MNEIVIPIKIPKEWPDIECAHARIGRKFSLIKPILSLFWRGSRTEALDNYVRSELEKRKFDIREAWKEYEAFIPIVLELQHIIKDNCYFNRPFTPIFIPEDDYAAIGELMTGDLGEYETMMDIEEKYGVQVIFGRDCHSILVNGTMLEVVRFIHENKAANNCD